MAGCPFVGVLTALYTRDLTHASKLSRSQDWEGRASSRSMAQILLCATLAYAAGRPQGQDRQPWQSRAAGC